MSVHIVSDKIEKHVKDTYPGFDVKLTSCLEPLEFVNFLKGTVHFTAKIEGSVDAQNARNCIIHCPIESIIDSEGNDRTVFIKKFKDEQGLEENGLCFKTIVPIVATRLEGSKSHEEYCTLKDCPQTLISSVFENPCRVVFYNNLLVNCGNVVFQFEK